MKAIELVTYLNEREAASIDELTSEFEVSARTVRLHIQRTNEMLEGLAHISYARKQGGYVLSVINEEGFSEWLDRMHRFGDLDGSASEKRITYLINDLLMRDDWVTVASMAQVLYVSPQSISKDLKAVEAKLGEYDLALEKRPRYGVRVRGSELNRRLCLASIATEGVIGSNPFGDETVPQVVKTIAGCIERALEEHPIPVQEIHSFLNEVDVRQINELLRASADMGAGAGLFDPAWFDPHLDAETPHEAICGLAELMVERAGAPAELVELALERESAASTAFGSGLALPHPIRSLPGPTKVCAGIPNRPIRWGDKDVELVLLVAIGDDGRNALDWFFSRMAELLSHEERVKRIVDDRSFEVMMQEIAHGEERN